MRAYLNKTKKTEDEEVKRARVNKANKSERRESKKLIQKQLDEDLEIQREFEAEMEDQEYNKAYEQDFLGWNFINNL